MSAHLNLTEVPILMSLQSTFSAKHKYLLSQHEVQESTIIFTGCIFTSFQVFWETEFWALSTASQPLLVN